MGLGLQSFIHSLSDGANAAIGAPSTATAGLDEAGANIPANPHPQGVWETIAQLAKVRGMTRLAQAAAQKAEQESGDKHDLVRSQIQSSGINQRYQEALMNNLGEDNKRQQLSQDQEASKQRLALAEQVPASTRTNPGETIPSRNIAGVDVPSMTGPSTSRQSEIPEQIPFKLADGSSMNITPRSRQQVTEDTDAATRSSARIKNQETQHILGKDTKLVDGNGATLAEGKNSPTPTSHGQRVTLNIDGKPVGGIFDPVSKEFSLTDGTVINNPQIWQQEPGQYTPILSPDGTGKIDSFFNPKSGSNVPSPVEGGRKTALSTDERTRIGQFDTVNKMLDQIEELSNRVHTEEGLTARATGLKRKAMAAAGYDDDVKLLQSKAGELATFAKQMGDVGNIAVAEADRIKQILPIDPTLTKSEAKRLITDVRSIVNTSKNARIEAAGLGSGSNSTPSAASTKPVWVLKNGKLTRQGAK